jgi:hypothetical protein
MQDPRALDVRMRDAAASTPECGGARRELAGVASGRRSRLSFACGWVLHEAVMIVRTPRGSGGWRGHPRTAASARRGPSGRSGELVSAPLSTKGRENEWGLLSVF